MGGKREAEADPALVYSSGFHYPSVYSGIYNTHYTTPYTYGLHHYGKRDAEPKADAALIYSGLHYPSTYGYGLHNYGYSGLYNHGIYSGIHTYGNKVKTFDKNCVNFLKVLTAAESASQKMTTHTEADAEVAGLKERYNKVKAVSDSWVKKLEVLVKEWVLLDNTVTELNSWVAKDKSAEGENQFSLEKMESTLGELKNIFK